MRGMIEFLQRAQNADGGWGYKLGGMSFVEPTAAVLLALSSDAQNAAAVQRARGALRQWQRADGGGIRVTDTAQAQSARAILKINAAITGWAWQPGDAAWVFPTALTLLALTAMQTRDHARVQEGILYLLDRAIPDSGWNIGNPFMVTSNLPPTVENTALALIALRRLNVENEITQRARDWLAQESFTPTAFEWAWRAWYWKTITAPLERARAALQTLQRADGSLDGNPLTTALALMGTRAP
ncbi:MAG: hypothetical protein B6D41_08205 [Chloroflexi bacterium UTCFX4]|nr:MAG: hypothetical protein B6D41_08205 [Chloroflexi bacterium UTCFX4]